MRFLTSFMGYERPDGSAGARNHVAILPTVACANGVAIALAGRIPGTVPLVHAHGCGRAGQDLELHFRTLSNLAAHPNVGAVLVVGLGCEVIRSEMIAGAIAASGRPVGRLDIQEEGGSRRATAKGVEMLKAFLEETGEAERTEVPLDRLIVGLECGGSDAFSGVTANPAVGIVTDHLVESGATAVLTESTEMIGTSHILERRARDDVVAGQVRDMVRRAEDNANELLGPLASMVIAPGNMDGGISTISEKSLGCITKGGSSEIVQVVDYGERPTEKGLVLMDAPGYDVESMAGVAAAGAQVMLFTTGRGNPAGFPTVPVIKVASNPGLYRSMLDDMDVNAGAVLEGASLAKVADTIEKLLKCVLDGELTKAERNGQEGIVCLYTTRPSF